MAAVGTECKWAVAFLVYDVPFECVAAAVLAVPDSFGLSVLEPDHIVFPVGT